ncbi:hypothetical protein L7F22_059859 [Adiantum nelumboides]|nr:hypothetical protein [Adiantum nelumboides]
MAGSQDGNDHNMPEGPISVLKKQMAALSTSLASIHTRLDQMQTQTSSRSYPTTSRTIQASSSDASVVDQEEPLKEKPSELKFSHPKHGFSETTRHKVPSCEQQKSQHEYSWKNYSSKHPTSYQNHQQQKQRYEASKGSSTISRWAYLVAHISDPSRVLGRECRDAGQVFPREPCPSFKSFLSDGGKVEDLLILSLCKRILQRSKRQQLPRPPPSQLEGLIPAEKAEDSKDSVVNAKLLNLKTPFIAFSDAKDKSQADSCSTTLVAAIESLDIICSTNKPLQMDVSSNTTLSQSTTSLEDDFFVSKEPVEYLIDFQPVVITQQKTQVPELFPLLVAAHKTLLALSRSTLVTRTLHSELIYNFSGSKHITESLRRCGLSENSTYVLVARFNATVEELEAARGLVKGKEITLEELEKRSDTSLIQKHFKISSLELEVSSLADAVACRIAARDAM